MNPMTDNRIYITDEQGNEKAYQILMTFENEGKKYVTVYDDENQEDVFAFIYDKEGNLFPVESEEDFALVSEVLSAFEEDEDEANA